MIDANEVTVPRHATVGQLLESLQKSGDKPVILAPGRTPLSCTQLFTHVEYQLSFLNRHGIGRNDRVAVVLPNGPEMALAFLGVVVGAACAPLNPAYRDQEFDFYLSDIDAKALIVPSGTNSPAVGVARARNITVIELTPLQDDQAGIFRLDCTDKADRGAFASGYAGQDDAALILHTSGTTSRPKIVPLTQGNILTSAHNVGVSLQLTEADRCLNVMPLFHIHGLIAALLASLNAGGSVVCTPGYSPEAFFGWLAVSDPTWYTAVPTVHQSVLERAGEHSRKAGKSSLRLIRSSSSSLPPTVMAKLEDIFQVPVIEAYGMTEAAHQMASNPLPPLARKPGSVGLQAGPEVAIMDEGDNLLLPPGATGEIVIRGPNVMKGYENNPAANASAFPLGWFRTGDQGYLDQDGYLFITGRLKEIINRGGEKISPREIDEALLEHPAVLQAVAFAVPHRLLGEAVAAAVVPVEGSALSEQELRRHVAERLVPFKVPQQIVFVKEIPKGPTGKLQRIGLAERLADQLHREYVPPANEREVMIAGIWQALLGVAAVGRQDDFFVLGGDSLLATQAMVRVEEALGTTLQVETFFLHPTLADFSDIVGRNSIGSAELAGIIEELEALSDEEAQQRLDAGGTPRP